MNTAWKVGDPDASTAIRVNLATQEPPSHAIDPKRTIHWTSFVSCYFSKTLRIQPHRGMPPHKTISISISSQNYKSKYDE